MAPSSTTAESSTDGPVLSVISKRLRALRKKLNRILQMEDSLACGKILNKEQEEVLRSKPIVVALIDELEKLKTPLTSALAEEKELQTQTQDQNENKSEPDLTANKSDEEIEELLKLVYFGSMFDVKAQGEFTSMMLTRSHERGCCLTYDYVTDDEVDLLKEQDLDMMALMSALMTSRPISEGVSHKSALEACVAHAKLWIANSDQPIHPGETVTYAGLKEKLKKIMGSDYFTTRPEMKASVDLHISDVNTISSESLKIEADMASFENKEEQENNNSQSHETHFEPQPSPPEETLKTNDPEAPNLQTDIPPVKEADVANQVQRDSNPKAQQHSPRRYNQNSRGGGRVGNGGAGQAGRRGYSNGGGRGGGRGGYSNGGRGRQYYESNYQPKGYFNNTNGGRGNGGGGGRFGGNGVGTGGGTGTVNNTNRGVNGGNGSAVSAS